MEWERKIPCVQAYERVRQSSSEEGKGKVDLVLIAAPCLTELIMEEVGSVSAKNSPSK